MTEPGYRISVSIERPQRVLGTVVVALLVAFWATVELQLAGPVASAVRALTGTVLVLLVPGLLLARLLRVGERSPGEFLLFAVGLSLATASIVTTALSVILPRLGVGEPLSLVPLAVTFTALVLVLTGVDYRRAEETSLPRAEIAGPFPFLLSLTLLPTLAAVGAVLQGRYGTNAGMFLFVGAVVLVVVVTATRYVPAALYPVSLFFVTASTLLHRNLLTNHVIGADIQLNYFVSKLILDARVWSPEIGGSMIALPVVSSVPVSFSVLTGIGLAITYKVVYAALFSVVPTGVYYLGRGYFDDDAALFGSYFFVFYHISFYFTPGKQLISELFVVLLLLVLFRGRLADRGYRVGALLLSIGLIHTHYGTTFVFGGTLLIAYVGVRVAERIAGGMDHELTLGYPVLLLLGASVWYAYASRGLIERISMVPLDLVDQLLLLLTGAIATSSGSGASFVHGQAARLQYVTVSIYVLFTLFISLALAWTAWSTLRRARRGEAPSGVELTALAVPLFAFLASSYFVHLNLWADRVYQMVLPVLAPFAGFGYRLTYRGLNRVRGRRVVRWEYLGAVLGLLLVLNSGFAFALVTTSQDAAFNSDAHDLTFHRAEVAGGEWITDYTDSPRVETAPRYVLTEIPRDEAETTRIYVDRYTYQMFRSMLPQEYHGVQYVYLRSEWRKRLDTGELNHGLVVIRRRGVVSGADASSKSVPTPYLRDEQARRIDGRGNAIYDNDDLTVVWVDDGLVAENDTAAGT